MTSENFSSVARAFSNQSTSFDEIEKNNQILQWMRRQIHAHCMNYFRPGDSILELNCGTGIDAVYFAEQGMRVHATDLSDGMLRELEKKIEKKKLNQLLSIQPCSFTELDKIEKQDFDHIFSDFGGLNCTKDIGNVITSFKSLLKQGGTATLVIMPPVCPWELLLAFKGNFKTAFRRLNKNGAESHLEGERFRSYYFTPSKIISDFGPAYELLELQGLGCLVPPPYLESFPEKHQGLFTRLKKWEERLSGKFPFNRWADHFILTMRLKSSGKL